MADFKFPAVLTTQDGRSTVTALRAGNEDPIYTADSSHPNWHRIIEGLEEGDEAVWDLFDVAGSMVRSFQQVTDRVSWDGSDVLWDGDPVHSVLANQVARALRDGDADTYTALARFWEKLSANPNEHSREQAYDWLASHDFQITADGDVVAYKGVYRHEGVDSFRSTAVSRVEGKPSGYVNGVPVAPQSAIIQKIGDVVSMPRSEVEHNPRLTCSRGLHVGDWTYACAYGNAVLEVIFNPTYLVSVPTDAGGRKARVCQYTIRRVVDRDFTPAKSVLQRDDSVSTSWSDVGYSGV